MKITIESDKPIKNLTIEFADDTFSPILSTTVDQETEIAYENKNNFNTDNLDKMYNKLADAYVRPGTEVAHHEDKAVSRDPKVDKDFAGQSW